MRTAMRIGGWFLLAIGFVWIAFVTVAVATGAEGFTTLAGILPAIGFHAVSSMAGAGLVGTVQARAAAETAASASANAAPAGV